jgi:hypothetical protein
MSRHLKKLLPVALVIVFVAIAFVFKGEGQQTKSPQPPAANKPTTPAAPLAPVSVQAINFAISDPFRDLPDSRQLTSESEARLEGNEIRELNSLDNKTPPPEAAGMPSVDATLPGPVVVPNAPVLPPGVTFDGIADADNGAAFGGLFNPSDQNIAVGPNDIVQGTNLLFRIYSKTGVPKTTPKLISALFKKLGGVCANFDNGDPIVLHDRQADRWIISQFNFASATAAPYHECIAISTSSDPAGSYYMYDFVTVGNEFPDYPKIGTWPDGYYMTVNQFTLHGPFNGTGCYAFDRSKMLVGDPSATYVYFNLNLTNNPEGIFAMQPSDQDSLTPPPAGAPNVFAYEISDEYEAPPINKDGLRLFNFHVDFANPGNSTFKERPESPVLVAPYDARDPSGRGDVKQPPPAKAATDYLDSIGYHLMYRWQYRNNAGVESLVGSCTVNVSGVNPVNSATYQAGVRYFQLKKTAPGDPYALFDSTTFSPDANNPATGLNRWLPSAAVDNQGNLAVSYSVSSTTVFPSIRYAGRDFNVPGGLTGEQTLFAGTGPQADQPGQTSGGNRWGDYQSLVLDPSDDCTFWTTNQYLNVPAGSQFNWRTRIGSFKFSTCTASATGTLKGKITACDSGVPINGAFVSLSNGSSAGTLPDGTYSIQLLPGTYTVTVSDPLRNCVASSTTTVSVAAGATVTNDVCLAGAAKPLLDNTDPTAVTISGGNGNGIIDPAECNNLTVKVVNVGCAIAKGVTGVLTTTTPNVIITQPNAPYADIAIDASGANTAPFKVSTGPGFVCGTNINFTLTLNFAGGSTVSTFSLPTCTETKPTQTVNGSIDNTDSLNVGRLGRNGVISICGAQKACPGAINNTPTAYDVVGPFVNGPNPACVTITLTSPNGVSLIGSAYLNSFSGTDTTHCGNYLGDPGGSNTTVQWQVNLVPNASMVVAVEAVSAGSFPGAYTVKVDGLSAPPLAGGGACASGITTQVSSSSITLGQQTFDTATLVNGFSQTGTITFRLFGPNNATCTGTPVFTSIQSVGGNNTYSSTSFTPTAVGTYNWTASYSGDASNPAVATACGDANETVTVNAVPTPTPSPTATPLALNISTRMNVGTGNNVGIGGFIVSGTAPKHVIIRGIGPSLTKFGFAATDVLADPVIEVHGPGAFGTMTNNNWRDSQEAQIKADGLAPTNDLEAAVDATLPPGPYTVIVKGNNNGTGLALFEVYDLDTTAASRLANMSTRALVGTGGNVVIAGFVLGNNTGNDRIVVRGLGPSLTAFGIANALADPTLELRDENGVLVFANNDWQDNANQASQISGATLAPTNTKESAIAATLPAGLYTAILAGAGNGQGVGVVEVYDRGP